MLPVVSVQTMRECDAWTIEHETPGSELMLRAARGIRDAVDWDRGSPAGIVIGSGNNGGDGAALAMLLAQAGRPCVLYRVSEKASPDNAFYLEKAKALGVPVRPFAGHEAEIAACPVLVDCLLGTGFAGTVRGAVRQAILCLNRAREVGAYVVSADINSGLNGDTGEAELAVHSDLTVSIGFFKTGMFRGDAPHYIRRLVNADIGIRLLRQEFSLVAPGTLAGEQDIVCPGYCEMGTLPKASPV